MPAENHRWVYCEAGNICTRCGQIAVLGADKVCPGPPVPSHREPLRPGDYARHFSEQIKAINSRPASERSAVSNRSPAPRDARDVIAQAMVVRWTPRPPDAPVDHPADVVLAAIRAAGFSVVSREPTDEMIERAWEAWMTSGGDRRMILVPHLRAAIRAALSEGDKR